MKIQVTFLMAVYIFLGLTSCKKGNNTPIDNSATVKTPYILFMGGYTGTLHKTNDALYFNTLFPTDNSCVRQVIVADSNIIMLKKYVHVSKNDGSAFQVTNNHPIKYIDSFYRYYYPNTGLYNTTNKRVYLCTTSGLEISDDLGYTFSPETDFDVTNTKPIPAKAPTSIVKLDNGTMCMMYDSSIHYYKLPGTSWKEMLADGTNDLPIDTTWYFASSYDVLYAIDFFGKNGVYRSLDFGANWEKVSGVPKSRKILFGNQAFGTGNFYLGLDSGGMYRIINGSFKAVGAGIPWYAKVSYVEGKKVTYRTNVDRYYLFCSTDLGLYISETNGLDWKLTREGQYSTLE